MTKVVFSFDDGRADNYRVFNDLLKVNKIPATINITTDYVLKDSDKGLVPCGNEPLSKNMLQELDNLQLFEIAGHGKQHFNDVRNLLDGVEELRGVCKSQISGIASPCSLLAESTVLKYKENLKKEGINYIRLGDRINSLRFIKKILRKVNRIIFHFPSIFTWVYEQTFVSKNDDFILYSVPILKRDTVNEVIALIKRAVKKQKNVILMFHSILHKCEPEYESNWSWDWDKFEKLVLKLKQMQESDIIKITKTQDLLLGN